MNFGAVTSEITFLICVPSYGYWVKIGLRSSFIALGFANAQNDRNVDGLSSNGRMYTSYKFGGLPVILQLMWLNWVQQASISTWVNSSTFASRGSIFVLHHYSLGGDTVMTGGLYAAFCHSFLVFKKSCSGLCFFTARRYTKRSICRRRVSVCMCVCVCPSHSGTVLYQNG